MSKSILLQTALCLPPLDIEALSQGRMSAAMPRKFISPGLQFALYPAEQLGLFAERRQMELPLGVSKTVLIKTWARCELCQILDESESLEALSLLTIWTTEALRQTLLQRPHIFLAHLRVYLLPHPVEVPVSIQNRQFVPLPHSLSVTDSLPVLSDRLFTQRRHQLENRLPPLHPELEELQSAIAQLSITNPSAEQLNRHIQTFLGWASVPHIKQSDPELSWITTINTLGTATTGGNYEKGTAFEQIVHKSLSFLGFGLDPNAKGGAGEMDLYCKTPYPLVGECKAGQTIPGNSVYELDKLGNIHLGKNIFDTAVKLIIGPGQPTSQLKQSAQVYHISIINPMTLQKLVELKAKYPGSVNLIELKGYLEAGQIDDRIEDYIKKVESDIKQRLQIVEAVKQLGEIGNGHLTLEIRVQYNAMFTQETSSKLDEPSVHDLLIELSSPLTGYLGRVKGNDWKSDRFYFLRDLKVD